ncbi:hypothetical protein BUALT_Bualt16G0100200 [Buddleja alternifolia]|uniref:Uncharacterized protein n=1 Tax=Buddleja alternifolia TaxID=168488 RepID=A0AAV6WIR1_9LAMI|nr:hypothetical protein BUALT_Bualt16G0100200 [Buddleja alternifolia]
MGRAPCCDKANVKRGPWSPEEDQKLKAYIHKWSIIAAQLPGRTDNDIKNYWNTRLKKKLLGKRKHSNKNNGKSINPGLDYQKDHVNGEDKSSFNLQNLSSSALERLQLHMHLQTLQNPFSFYDNPAAMIPTIHSSNQNQNPDDQPPQDYDHALEKNELVDSINCFSSIEPGSGFTQLGELNDLLNDHTYSGFLPSESHMAVQFDCFKEIDGSKDSRLSWWPNEFDVNSTSSNSWDSGNMVHQCGEMYQDHGLRFSMQ